ncbi:disintegrin and metalloproteinase domain-containing protein 15-like, partial [Chiloscyllium punctatum]|uniref:disintegrin and metalloproteinase domain-containing protein 15-like n=1 Tax=Chiloscyllium punctatum TaxID=137246 RepID=UPI003B63B328
MYYQPNGTLVIEKNSIPPNCYYHGSVHGFPDSRISVSLCSGLRGLITLARNQSYSIEPLPGNANGVHLIHRMEAIHLYRKRCAVGHQAPEHSVHPQDQPALHRTKRDILTEQKYIELVMVADNKE